MFKVESVASKGAQDTVEGEKKSFDGGSIFTILACLFLGASLFLFVRNNALFAHGARNLWNPEALIMFGVLLVPFVLSVLHLIRQLRRNDQSPS